MKTEPVAMNPYEPVTQPATKNPGNSMTPVTLMLWLVALFSWAAILFVTLAYWFSA